MWQEIYQWLWPLFTVCQHAPSLNVTIHAPLFVSNAEGALLVVENQKLGLCPTTLMHSLLVLAAFGSGSLFWLSGVLLTLPFRRKRQAELAWLRDPFLALDEQRRPERLPRTGHQSPGVAAVLDELDTDIQQLLKDLEKGGKR